MQPEIRSFALLLRSPVNHIWLRRMRTVSKSATFLATESVNSAPFKRGETELQIFWQGKAQNSSPILRCTFLARRSAKVIANFSATMVTSLPSFSLSVSLSLSPNVPHAQYRKRFRASYNTNRNLMTFSTMTSGKRSRRTCNRNSSLNPSAIPFKSNHQPQDLDFKICIFKMLDHLPIR